MIIRPATPIKSQEPHYLCFYKVQVGGSTKRLISDGHTPKLAREGMIDLLLKNGAPIGPVYTQIPEPEVAHV